jgi:hypothetical protein
VVGTAILLVPKVAQHAMCPMAKTASPHADCVYPPLSAVMLIIGWTLIAVGVAGACYKYDRGRSRMTS